MAPILDSHLKSNQVFTCKFWKMSVVAMPKSFTKRAPTLTVSDVLSLLPSNDTVTVLLKLDRFLINWLSSIHYRNVLPYLVLDLSNKIWKNLLLRPSTRVQMYWSLYSKLRNIFLTFRSSKCLPWLLHLAKWLLRNAKMTFLVEIITYNSFLR